MKQYILTIALVAISTICAAGNKVANNVQKAPKHYVEKQFASIEATNNVSYLYSYVTDHYSYITGEVTCKDTTRVFSANGIQFKLSGNFSSDTHTNAFRWKCDANLLSGRNLNIVKVELPRNASEKKAYDSADGNRSWDTTYTLHDVIPVDDDNVMIRFNAYSTLTINNKTTYNEELCAVKINRKTGETTSVDPSSVSTNTHHYRGGRSLDTNHCFAELHTTVEGEMVVIWR